MRCCSISTGLCVAAAAASFTVVSSQQKYDAVVVGAGWAGLRAVETLLGRGIERTLVLEATDRVGGRAWSKNGDGSENNPDLGRDVVPFDLGVEWNYDSVINEQQEVLWPEYIPDSVWEDQEYMAVWPTWPGRATYYRQRADGTARRINNGDSWMARLWAPFLQFRDDNLDDLFGQSYGETIEQYEDEEGITDNESLQFLNLIRDAKHLEYGTGDYDMDITEIEFTDPTFHVETNYLGTPGLGWGNVAAKYGEQFAAYIRKGARVTELDSAADRDYVVVTYEKDGVERTVLARTVLVTASVGVLKAGNIEFVPPMPAYKQDSIVAMGFGVINKCMMSWNDPADKVWPDEEEEDMWFLLSTPDDETSGKWTTFSNPSRYKGVPSLTAWIGGKDAVEAEKQSDEEILGDVMGNLRAMFPTIRDPDNVIVTRWGREENVLGAYSFPSPGQAYYEDQENIKRRMGKIYFAGEHTSANGWASTFGAWDTGEEAAEEMAARIATLPEIEDELIATTEPTEPVTTTEEPAPEPETTEPPEVIVTTEEPAPSRPFGPTDTPDRDSEDFALPPGFGSDRESEDFALPPGFGSDDASEEDDEVAEASEAPDEGADEFSLPPGFGSANASGEGDGATESTEQSSDGDSDEEEASESSEETDPPTYAPAGEGPTYEGPGKDDIPEPLSSPGFLLSAAWTVLIGLTLSTFL